ncbi:MAG: DUF2244 domain-containing protein [Alphaproteobacteria bacterium]
MSEHITSAREPAGRVYFDAVLYPHRSLSPAGFLTLMALLAAVSFTAGVFFLTRGAWPVFGFFGLDVFLVWLAFRQNFRAGRVRELITLTDSALVIRRVEPNGAAREFRFEPYWARVEVDDVRGQANRLVISSHGRRIMVGAFLTPEERLELAEALRGALREQAKGVAAGSRD